MLLKKNRNFIFILVVIDNFCKFGCTAALKNKNAQTIKDLFESIFLTSKRKPKIIESDGGKEFQCIILEKLLNNNNNKPYSRNTTVGAAFAERFNCTYGDLLE